MVGQQGWADGTTRQRDFLLVPDGTDPPEFYAFWGIAELADGTHRYVWETGSSGPGTGFAGHIQELDASSSTAQAISLTQFGQYGYVAFYDAVNDKIKVPGYQYSDTSGGPQEFLVVNTGDEVNTANGAGTHWGSVKDVNGNWRHVTGPDRWYDPNNPSTTGTRKFFIVELDPAANAQTVAVPYWNVTATTTAVYNSTTGKIELVAYQEASTWSGAGDPPASPQQQYLVVQSGDDWNAYGDPQRTWGWGPWLGSVKLPDGSYRHVLAGPVA